MQMRQLKQTALVAVVATVVASGSFTQAATLLDQIGPDNTATSANQMNASQVFDAPNSVYSTAALDDFIVPASPNGIKINTIEAVAGNFSGNSLATVTSYDVSIFSSVSAALSSFVGDMGYGSFAVPTSSVGPWTSDSSSRLLTFDMSSINIVLPAGTYFLSVIPHLDYSQYGQSGIFQSTIGASDSYQVNPDGGFGFPGGISDANPQPLAYRINGEEFIQGGGNPGQGGDTSAVPTPAAAPAAATLLLGLLGRRNRRA
jgi:hypothetical protein